MAMTEIEFDDFLKNNFGIIKNDNGGNCDYRISNFVPVGGGCMIPDGLGQPKCLLDLFGIMGYTTGAEIGVYEGQLSKRLCSRFTGTIYSIDPWWCFNKRIYSDGLTTNITQEELDNRYHNVVKLLSGYNNSAIIRETSVAALSYVERESLDFVYIDANHAHDFIWHDMRGWWEKIKHGGMLSGHDFCFVNKALTDFCYEKGIGQLYCDSGTIPPKLVPYDGGYSFWRDEDWLIYKK